MSSSTDDDPSYLNYQELEVENWKELYSVLKEYGPQGWLFRGQSNAKWSLSTTLERSFDELIWEYDSKPPLITSVESYLMEEFKRRAHQFVSYDSMPDSEAEWLILMQHHGAPTRLLDWSRSPNIAAYFALEESHNSECGQAAIWAIHEDWLVNHNIEKIKKDGIVQDGRFRYDQSLQKAIIPRLLKENTPIGIFPYRSQRPPQRDSAQLGSYLVVGDLRSWLRGEYKLVHGA